MSKERLADLTLILVAALWGVGFVAAKEALDHFPPFTLMALRFLISTVFMYIVLHRKLRNFTKKEVFAGLVLGSFSFFAFGSQTYGLMFTTVSKQGLFTSIYVIIVPFLVWIFYKKAPAVRVFISAVLAMAGIWLMSSEAMGGFDLNFGDVLTIFSAVFYAFMIIYVDKSLVEIDAIKLTFLQLPFSALFLGILAIFTESMPTDLTVSSWYSVGYMAIVSTFICFLLQITAQKYTAPSRASLLMSTESLFAVVFAVILLGESLSFIQLIGIFVLFSAVIMVEINPIKKSKTESC